MHTRTHTFLIMALTVAAAALYLLGDPSGAAVATLWQGDA